MNRSRLHFLTFALLMLKKPYHALAVQIAIERMGAPACFLPPHSHNLNPIEPLFAKLKAFLWSQEVVQTYWTQICSRCSGGLMAVAVSTKRDAGHRLQAMSSTARLSVCHTRRTFASTVTTRLLPSSMKPTCVT